MDEPNSVSDSGAGALVAEGGGASLKRGAGLADGACDEALG